MENNNIHIDDLIRDKFDSFAPSPPEHIWGRVEEGIKTKPKSLFLWNKRTLAIAAIVLLASISTTVLVFDPMNFGSKENNELVLTNEPYDENPDYESMEEVVIDQETEFNEAVTKPVEEMKLAEEAESTSLSVSKPNESSEPELQNNEVSEDIIVANKSETHIIDKPDISDNQSRIDYIRFDINPINFRKSALLSDESFAVDFSPVSRDNFEEIPQDLIIDEAVKQSNLSWRIGYYLSPELTVSNIDSVEILNSFNINVEPSWYFNDHWFIRSGLGISYVRDRGFARINYVTKEYMGSYDDVYEVTFDTISGNVIPTYHTKTVEVWDSIRHVSVSGVTNKYMYMQIPLLLGYQSGNTNSQFNWYIAGGPAVNLKISEWIDDPKPAEDDADIIDLENKLPLRANNYFQLWLGAGLEYKINRKILIGFEPNYRYYLNNIYENTNAKGPTSGFTFRVGLVYLMK